MRRSSYSEGLGFAALSFAFLAGLSVVSSVVTARIYGIVVLGEFALVVAAMNAVMILGSARERPAFVREVATLSPRHPRVSGLLVAVLGFSTALAGIVSLLVGVAVYFLFHGPMHQPQLVLPAVVTLAGFVVFENLNGNLDAVMAAFRAGRELFAIRVAQAVSMLVLSVTAGLMDAGVWGLVGAQVASQAVALVHRLVVARRYVAYAVESEHLRAGIATLPDIVRFGLKVAPGGLADGASNESGTWILGLVASLTVVGAWSRAWMVARQLMYLNVRINEMLFPTLVERHHEKDHAGFDRALVDTLRYCGAGLFLLAAVAGGAATGVMALFGPSFGRAATALAIVMAVPALLTLGMIQRHALYAFDRPWTTTVSAGLRLVVTLAVSVPMTIAFGPTGTAIGVCCGLAVDFLFTTSRVLPRLATPIGELVRGREIAGVLAAYAAGFATAHELYAAMPHLLGLVAALALGAVAYLGALVLVGGVSERDRERFEQVRRRLARTSAAGAAT